MKRSIGIGLALALIFGLLSAGNVFAETVLQKVQKEKVLKVCFAQGIPDNYKNPKTGEWTGPMVDLVNELANWMKVRIEKVEVTWDIAVLSLNRGDCDLFGSSLVYNAPRAMQINYIRFFWAKGINAVILKDNPKGFKEPEDMNRSDVTIAVVVGTREDEVARRLFPNAKILSLKVNTSPETAFSVKRGDADAAFMPAITVRWWAAVSENAAWGKMGFPGQDFGNAPNGWAIRYGDPEWKDFLDAFSGWVAANNLAVNLYDEYIKKTNPFQ
jgi:polar amino acid transport system substrate-binding protein